MEDSVPLESSNKKKFESTVAGIKKLIKTGKFVVPNKKDKNIKKQPKAFSKKGVVYIGHIPHGFYEEQMRSYFKQFGKVTNVRLARSNKNGKSKGYGFIEFADREVAEIVAETMNNYLMDKRLMKAELISAEREMPNLFKGENWVERKHCPGIKNRKIAIRNYNKNVSHEEWISESKKQLRKLYKTKCKLQALGIDFDFTPSDIPEELAGYDPSDTNRTPSNKKAKKTEDIFSENDSLEDSDASEVKTPTPVKKNKKMRKEKSMIKPTSPLVKLPKAKKLGVKNQAAVVTAKSVKNIPNKGQNLNKKSKVAINENLDESINDDDVKLHQKKNFGGIQKKRAGKDKAPVAKKMFTMNDEVKAQAKNILKSNSVNIVKKSDIVKNKSKNNKKSKKTV